MECVSIYEICIFDTDSINYYTFHKSLQDPYIDKTYY